MNNSLNSPAPVEDQAKLLDEVLNVVKIQAHLMKKCLESNKLMDGLKHCSNMLAELRTSALTPKNYYELYMSIFDAMRHLTAFLTEAHTSSRHHLADLYELVQYAGNIVPRLYLMITVGAAYMAMPDAPVREIMRDMMEMTRGVQHPIRGLFLRYYLSSMTRDHLPIGEGSGPEGNAFESINFILTNFTEMNKLWVRLQHQGLSRDREKREAERKELRILVGTNLVRLSQLDGVDLHVYQKDILPGILDQIVSCRDVIAQEYLMEVITQVFPDDFHLRTLQPFLSATAQLHPKVNVKQIIISLIDRLAAFATREAEGEEESTSDAKKLREERIYKVANARKRQLQGLAPEEEEVEEEKPAEEEEKVEEKEDQQVPVSTTEQEPTIESVSEQVDNEDAPLQEVATELEEKFVEQEETNVLADEVEKEVEKVTEDSEKKDEPTTTTKEDDSVHKVRGIPQDVELFIVFWDQIVELVKARPDLTIQDLTALLVSLINLSLSCYPEKLEYVDQILAYAKDKVVEFAESSDLHAKSTENNLQSLLLAPIQHYSSVLYLLALANYQPLLAAQTYSTRQAVAYAIVNNVLRNVTIIAIPEDVHGVLDLCDVLLRDQKDAPNSSSLRNTKRMAVADLSFEQEEYLEKQGLLARIVHLFRSPSEDTQFLLLSAARKQFSNGSGERIRYTSPSLITSALRLARRYKSHDTQDEIWEKKTSALFRFIHQVISTLYRTAASGGNGSDTTCLHLFLLAGQSADECGFEEIAYEFFVEAFTIYEESISESKAQFQAITCIVGALQQTRVFSVDNYDTLITKAALHSSKLLKKPDQCRGVYLSSHLWWSTSVNEDEEEGEEEKRLFKDGKRALECLQKALKIADSCMDSVTNVELFVEILNRYVYYFEKGNEAVTVKYLNGLIDLINTNLSNMDSPDQHPSTANSSSLLTDYQGSMSEYVRRHFRATLLHLQNRKEQAARMNGQGPKYDELDLGDI